MNFASSNFDDSADQIKPNVVIQSASSVAEIDRYQLPITGLTGLASNNSVTWLGSSSNLYKINSSTGATITQTSNSSRKYQILAWGDDTIWTSDSSYTKIVKVDRNTELELLNIVHPGTQISAIAFSPVGLYVADNSVKKIFQIDILTGGVINEFTVDLGTIIDMFFVDNSLWLSFSTSSIDMNKISSVDGSFQSQIDLPEKYYKGFSLYYSNLTIVSSDSDSIINYDISTIPDLIVYPQDDTYVRVGDPAIGRGLASEVIADDDRYAFLRFSIQDVQSIDTAYFELKHFISDILNISIFGVYDDSWDETSLTGTNYPTSFTEELDSVSLFGDNWYRWNITEFATTQSDGWISIMLRNNDVNYLGGNLHAWSKEIVTKGNWPFLSINGYLHELPQVIKPITETTTQTETTTATSYQTDTETNTVTETTTKTTTIYDITTTNTVTSTHDETNTNIVTNTLDVTNYHDTTLTKSEAGSNRILFISIFSIIAIFSLKRLLRPNKEN